MDDVAGAREGACAAVELTARVVAATRTVTAARAWAIF
jgi:hypothetical protein